MKTTTTAKTAPKAVKPVSTKSSLPRLSSETTNKLKDLYAYGRAEEDMQPLYAFVVALRRNRWPLRAIAEALGVSRSIVNIWETKLDPATPLPQTEELPEIINEQVKPIYMRYTLDIDDAVDLAVLTEKAKGVRRFTAKDAESRKAAIELEDLLYKHRQKGASLQTLAVACKVSRRAVAQRIEKAMARAGVPVKPQEKDVA